MIEWHCELEFDIPMPSAGVVRERLQELIDAENRIGKEIRRAILSGELNLDDMPPALACVLAASAITAK